MFLQRLQGWDGWGVRIWQVLTIILLAGAFSLVGVRVGAGNARASATSPATTSAQATRTPSGGAALSGAWLTLWTANGTRNGTTTDTLPAGAEIVWSCTGGGYLAVREATPIGQRDADLTAWQGVVGACPMYGVSRAPAGHGPTLTLNILATTAWTISVRVWESGGGT